MLILSTKRLPRYHITKSLFHLERVAHSSTEMEAIFTENFSEDEAGIKNYANPNIPGFQGIHKQRFSDFVVREVSNEGAVSCLEDLWGKDVESPFAVPILEGIEHTGITSLKAELESINFNSDNATLSSFLQQCLDKSPDCQDNFVIDVPCADKETRGKVHAIFRKYFQTTVDTDTLNVDGVQHIRLFPKHKVKKGGDAALARRRTRMMWPKGLGDFLKFTLVKENIDTISAAGIIAKSLHCKDPSTLQYAGTKDKRAVTAQICTVFRRKPSDFRTLNNFTFPPYIRVGNFSYVDKSMSLGDLKGNHFTIVLRAVDKSEEEVQVACDALRSTGFINYYGLQRFGKGGGSHFIGRAIFKGDWKSSIDLLFQPNAGERFEIMAMKQAFRDGDYKRALQLIPSSMRYEKLVLEWLILHPNDFLGAYNCIPRMLRLLFGHAYQSYLWNMAASERVSKYGLTPVVGDLVATSPDVLVGPDFTAGGDAEEVVLLHDNVEQDANTSTSKSDHDDSFQRSSVAIANGVLVLSATDIESGRFDIHDIILPLPGSEISYPENDIGDYYQQLMKLDDVDTNAFSDCPMRRYRTRGAYRRILQKPKNFNWTVVRYTDPNAELVETEISILRSLGQQSTKEDMGANLLKYACSVGNNAVHACSSIPTRPLRLLEDGYIADSAAAADMITDNTGGVTATTTNHKNGVSGYRAVVLSFELPPGTYATMLLRELTKASTETRHQANLTAASTAEHNVNDSITSGTSRKRSVGEISEV